MLQAFGLSYEPSPTVGNLFQDLSLSISAGEKVALLGNNGAGKTKLIEILAGILRPSSGRVVLESGCRIAYLPQDVDLDFDGSLAEYLSSLELQPHDLVKACYRMGIPSDCLDRDYRRLSVGERVRACLASVLLGEPNLLLLDEPTNHLDLAGRAWFASFLAGSRQACLMVSHDRAVINAAADRTLLLAEGKLTAYAGGYDDMIAMRESDRARQAGEYERQREEDRRVSAAAVKVAEKASRMSKRPTGRTYDPKAKAFYRGKEARMFARAKAIRTRVEQSREHHVDKPLEEDGVTISFNTRPLRHSDALTVRGLRKAFGDRELFDGVSLTVGPGDRVALTGPNGAGKTTLFRILLGEEAADAGEVRWSGDAVRAYLSQERAALPDDGTVIEALAPTNQAETRFARSLLARLRMRGDAPDKPIRVLSVGERTKAELTAILMTPANVLLLDEPTNHLDIDSLEALEEALLQFDGAILFTSHDQAFIDRVATSVVMLEGR